MTSVNIAADQAKSLGLEGLIALSDAFKKSDGTGEGKEGFMRLLKIAGDPLSGEDGWRARIILFDRHNIRFTDPEDAARSDLPADADEELAELQFDAAMDLAVNHWLTLRAKRLSHRWCSRLLRR